MKMSNTEFIVHLLYIMLKNIAKYISLNFDFCTQIGAVGAKIPPVNTIFVCEKYRRAPGRRGRAGHPVMRRC